MSTTPVIIGVSSDCDEKELNNTHEKNAIPSSSTQEGHVIIVDNPVEAPVSVITNDSKSPSPIPSDPVHSVNKTEKKMENEEEEEEEEGSDSYFGSPKNSADDDEDGDSIDELSYCDDVKYSLRDERSFLDNYHQSRDYSSKTFVKPSSLLLAPLLHTLITESNSDDASISGDDGELSLCGLGFDDIPSFHTYWEEYVNNLFTKPEFSPLRLNLLKKDIDSYYIHLLIPHVTKIHIQSFVDAFYIGNNGILEYWKKQLCAIPQQQREQFMTKDIQRELLYRLVKYGLYDLNDLEDCKDELYDQIPRILCHVFNYDASQPNDKKWFPMPKEECVYYLNIYLFFCGFTNRAFLDEIADGTWFEHLEGFIGSMDDDDGEYEFNKDVLRSTPVHDMDFEDFSKAIAGLPISDSDIQRMKQHGLDIDNDQINTLLKRADSTADEHEFTDVTRKRLFDNDDAIDSERPTKKQRLD